MFDVLPPGGVGGDRVEPAGEPDDGRRARPIRSSVTSNTRKGASVHAGPRVVQMNWKLPARLRKPIRQQLAKERAKKQKRMNVVRFDRRPIRTRAVFAKGERKSARPTQSGGVTLPKHRLFNKGAEHHTGDMYRQTNPQLHVAAPPYVGFVAQSSESVRGVNRAPRIPDSELKKRRVKRVRPVERRSLEGVRTFDARPHGHTRDFESQEVRVDNQETVFTERDVALDFNEAEREYEPQSDLFVQVEEAIDQPRRGFGLPFSINILRWGTSRTRKKKVFLRSDPRIRLNLGVLLVVALVASGVVWNLRSVGRGLSVLSSVQGRSESALQELLAAQSALAGSDFEQSEKSFAAADELLGQARGELDEALAASRYILRFADVTGTVRSGQDLLETGELLAQAGAHVSAALVPLIGSNVQLEVGEGLIAGDQSVNLVEAIRDGQDEVAVALINLEKVEGKLDSIESPFLPEDVKAQLATLGASVPRAREILQTFHDQSDTYLYLLGEKQDREYLVVFANNDELRPVGGFLGTIGVVNIDQGRVESVDVRSVYEGDGQLRERIAPPDPLLLATQEWGLRDANWLIDYEVSAEKITSFFEKQGGSTVDGVILMTPDVIERLLLVTGPIQVPGYEQEISADNFVVITQQEVTYGYDKEVNKPKQFLADLAPILLTKVFSAESTEGQIEVLSAIAQSLSEKDMMLYFQNNDAQQQLRDVGWAGNLPQAAQGFLAVNNANIGGHKSDQFVEQEIDYRTVVQEDGDVEVVVTIRREHHGPTEKIDFKYPEDEDPAFKDNIVYQRVLVPEGAELIDAQGFTVAADIPRAVIDETDVPLTADKDLAVWQSSQRPGIGGTMVGEESGKTFFAGWIKTKPGSVSVVQYQYLVRDHANMPNVFSPAQTYSTYLFKQSGDTRTSVRTSIELPESMQMIHTVPESGITRESDTSLIYRGDLKSDKIIGAVFEKNS